MMVYNGQFNQDKWVDDFLGYKENGRFIDVGGCRPIKTNNTYFFEKKRNWDGVILEPHPNLFNDLRSQRSCKVIDSPIWNREGEEIVFTAFNKHYSLSTAVHPNDEHKDKRGEERDPLYIKKQTMTLSQVFRYMKWSEIDYLSIDIEGAEIQALEGMNFDVHSAKCITIEHNGVQEARERILEILGMKGYRRLSEEERSYYLTNEQWFWNEDWYVRV